MYKSVIEFSRDIPLEELAKHTALIGKAFDNRCGKVENTSQDPYKLVFEGEWKDYPCLDLSQIEIAKECPQVVKYMSAWNWIDENPKESCDMLELYGRYHEIR